MGVGKTLVKVGIEKADQLGVPISFWSPGIGGKHMFKSLRFSLEGYHSEDIKEQLGVNAQYNAEITIKQPSPI